MRRIKSVSLLDRHYEIAERMPNFSSFVQEAIDAYAAEIGQGVHTHAPENRTHGKCNPMAKHFCRMCWPDGRPDRDDWFKFLENPNYQIEASQSGRYKQFIEQSFAYNKPKQKSRETISHDSKPKIGWIRRMWRQLF
jgi:hypothetical protein